MTVNVTIVMMEHLRCDFFIVFVLIQNGGGGGGVKG